MDNAINLTASELLRWGQSERYKENISKRKESKNASERERK
jgi:hypothetical protein